MIKVKIPDELKLENYEKRIQTASFDRIDLVISFRAWKGWYWCDRERLS